MYGNGRVREQITRGLGGGGGGCRRDKRRRNDEISREAEEAVVHRDMKKVYHTTMLVNGRNVVQSRPVKDRNAGVVLTKRRRTMNRWREHFRKS